MKLSFTPLFLSATLAVLAADAPSPVTLRYNLAPKAAYYFRTRLNVAGEVKVPDEAQPEKLSANINMTQGMRVSGVDEKTGNWIIVNGLRNLTMVGNDKNNVKTVDKTPSVTTVINPQGQVMEIRGLDILIRSHVVPGMDATTFSSLLYNFPTYPKAGVKPGDSWTDEIPVQLPTGQKATARRKLTLVSVKDEKDGNQSALIRTETTLTIDAKVEGDSGGTLSGSQTGVGVSRVLLADGMPLESKTDLKMEITAKPNKGVVDDKGQATDGTIKVTTTLHMESRRSQADAGSGGEDGIDPQPAQ